MVKTSKSERKYGADVDKKPPKQRRTKVVTDKPAPDMYKILVDNSGFSKAMEYDDCIKIMGEMEASAKKMKRPLPSLMLVKQ